MDIKKLIEQIKANKHADKIAAAAVIIFVLLLSSKCADAKGLYLDVGFGERLIGGTNIICTDPKKQDTYGIVNIGYEIDDELLVQYHHNSCIDQEHNEGVLDSVELIFRFRPEW